MTLRHEEGRFAGHGLELYWQGWRDDAAPVRGTLLLVHGLGDHSGLYPTLSAHFAPRGWRVLSFDQRGNGRSPGQRAWVARWTEFRADLDAFLRFAHRELAAPGPFVVLGNSLGALVALDWALATADVEQAPPAGPGVAGLVLVAAPLGPLGVPPLLLGLARVLSRVWPRFSLETGMDLGGLARDPQIAQAVLGDPLFHRRGTARLATETEAAIARVHADATRLALPILLLHGDADRMVPPDGSRAFARRLAAAGHADVTLREVPGGYHALLGDRGHEEILDGIAEWMEARARAARV